MLVAVTALLRYLEYFHRGAKEQVARRLHAPFGHKRYKILRLFLFYQSAQIVRTDAQPVARVRQRQLLVHIFLVDYLQRVVAENLALVSLRAVDDIPCVKAEGHKLVFVLLVKI